MSDQEPQLPEDLRKALKNSPTFTPPESFYSDVLRKIRTEDAHLRPARPARWAWIWGSPMKLAAATGIVLISYFAIHDDKTPWGPKKADMVYDQMSSASRTPAMAQTPAPKNLPALHIQLEDQLGATPDAPANKAVVARKVAFQKKESPPFPWQNALQAKQLATPPVSSVAENAAVVATPTSWSGTDSGVTFFRSAVITTAQDWSVLWASHAPSQPAPRVDFDRWMVVGVFAGTRPDLAAIAITNIQTLSDQVLVTYQDIPLLPNQGLASATNHSYDLRLIAKTSLPIHFKKIP